MSIKIAGGSRVCFIPLWAFFTVFSCSVNLSISYFGNYIRFSLILHFNKLFTRTIDCTSISYCHYIIFFRNTFSFVNIAYCNNTPNNFYSLNYLIYTARLLCYYPKVQQPSNENRAYFHHQFHDK